MSASIAREAGRSGPAYWVIRCGGIWLLLAVCFLCFPKQAAGVPLRAIGEPAPHVIYLPVVAFPAASEQEDVWRGGVAIWSHDEIPAGHEVTLFRHQFGLSEDLTQARFLIFADTRYEAWLDGHWVGRGPARFSATRHEYDELPLGNLAAGAHTLAVLVQWAPNIRRSASSRPHLIAHVAGVANGAATIATRTGPGWPTLSPMAWRADAAPVHSWRLLGPTELLDLRRLPSDWMAPEFDDSNWPRAAAVSLTPGIRYSARSIPLLANVPVAASMIDAGWLSPQAKILQIEDSQAYTIDLAALDTMTVTVETLADPEMGEPPAARRDGQTIDWLTGNGVRPDVVEAPMQLTVGRHVLAFEDVPVDGLPVSVSPGDVMRDEVQMGQGSHAGRRLLLAEPISASEAVTVERLGNSGALKLVFAAAPAYVVLDLGRVVHGRMQMTATGAAGTVLDVGWDERLLAGTKRPLPHPGSLHPEWNQVDSWVLDGESRGITTIDARAGRYVLIASWGEDPVELEGLEVFEERYPVEQRGWFRSSNPRLDAIWELGVNTVYPSMQDAYADPWRERGQWWGDAYVAEHINRVAFGDALLLKRGLRNIAEEADADGRLPAFAPNSDASRMLDYGMLWVQSLQDYLELTGDDAFAREMVPVLANFMAHLATLRRDDTGLLDIPSGHWSQTALIDWSGAKSRNGQSTALNALYAGTLRDAADIARRTGQPSQAREWEGAADEIRDAINHTLYLPAEGRYLSSIVDGQAVTPTTHAQVWPLAFGIVPGVHTESVADAALDSFWVEIFGMYWALEGLGRAGAIEQAVALIEDRYGALLDLGATTLWEHWDSYKRYNAALSHAWGGGATWFLTTYLLGVRRTGPDEWEMQPSFAGVEQAAGAVPVAHGEVTARWQMHECDQRSLEVSAPMSSRGHLSLDTARVLDIEMNGTILWRGGKPLMDTVVQEGAFVRIPVSGGEYAVQIRLVCEE